MGKTLEELRIYEAAEKLSDDIWNAVIRFTPFSRDTVGEQLVKSADSIGANIAESYGRFHFREDISFLYYARGSVKETGFWLRRAERRGLIPPELSRNLMERLANLEPQINAYIKSIRRKAEKASSE